MAKTEDTPLHSTTVTSYDELVGDLKAFANRKYNFMLLLGNPGLGKSELAKSIVKGAQILDTRLSAFEFYKVLYRHRDCPFIVDDIPELYRDANSISLLKSLTDTRPTKTVSWNTSSLVNEDTPSTFTTKTRLLVIGNIWKSLDQNIKSLESRGVTLIFDPNPYEVHKQVAAGNWFQDRIIYNFIYANLQYMDSPSFRLYIQGSNQRKARRPWKDRLLQWMIGDKQLERVIRIMNDKRYKGENARGKAFAAKYDTTERAYYRAKARLRWYGKYKIGPNPELKSQ